MIKKLVRWLKDQDPVELTVTAGMVGAIVIGLIVLVHLLLQTVLL